MHADLKAYIAPNKLRRAVCATMLCAAAAPSRGRYRNLFTLHVLVHGACCSCLMLLLLVHATRP